MANEKKNHATDIFSIGMNRQSVLFPMCGASIGSSIDFEAFDILKNICSIIAHNQCFYRMYIHAMTATNNIEGTVGTRISHYERAASQHSE